MAPRTPQEASWSVANRVIHAILIVLAVLAAALTLDVGSLPVVGLDGFTALVIPWAFLGLVWLFGLFTALVAGNLKLALVTPAVAVLALVVVASGVPRSLRVALSEPALTAFVEQLQPVDIKPTDWFQYEIDFVIGPMPVMWVEERGGVPHLVTGFASSDTPAGLVYLPDGQLPPTEYVYEHVHGAWYRWLPW